MMCANRDVAIMRDSRGRRSSRGAIVALLALISSSSTVAGAAPKQDMLQVGQRLARFDLIKPGVHNYVRFLITPDGHRNAIDIWRREISFETKDGRRLMHVHQQWDEIARPGVLIQDSWFEPDTMRPVTHVRILTRDGKTTIGGYRFLPDKVVGMDDLPDNSRKGFAQLTPEPTNNWETDMEYLQALPLGPGYAANINFYDPGLEPPARYVYAVSGGGRIATVGGGDIDCWIVSITARDKSGVTPISLWFAKKTHVLVREEAKNPDGSTLIKSLLVSEA